jgi:TonB family protein
VVVVDPRSFDRGAESTGAAATAPIQPPALPPEQPAAPRERGVSTGSGKAARATPAPAKRALATATAQAPTPSSAALVNPAPADRRCVPQALRARRDIADRLPGEISVRFRVTASGDVARIEVPGVADRDLADAIADAVRGCKFLPGTDEDGRPVALPIVMRIRFASALQNEHSRLDGGRVE